MDPQEPKKGIAAMEAMGIVWDILFAIAVPTVGFGLLGRWLDRKLDTSPLFLAIGFLLALAVSGMIVIRKGRAIAKRL